MEGPPSFTSVVARPHDELSDASYNNEHAPPSLGSVAMARLQLSDPLSNKYNNNEPAISMESVAMTKFQLSLDQLTDASYSNEQAPSMSYGRGVSQSASDGFSYNVRPPSLTNVAGRDESYSVGSGSASLAGASQVAQHAGTTMTAPGMSRQVQGMQSVGVNNHIGTSLGLSQHTSSAPQSRQHEYVKIWEGKLDGIRHGQTVMITRLEAYRRSSSPESLAEDWPSTLVIDRLISQENMKSRQYAGKCEFIVCRALNQHGFLGQMQERKLGAVIKLPSQTLLLATSDKPLRLIGMLLPRDMVV